MIKYLALALALFLLVAAFLLLQPAAQRSGIRFESLPSLEKAEFSTGESSKLSFSLENSDKKVHKAIVRFEHEQNIRVFAVGELPSSQSFENASAGAGGGAGEQWSIELGGGGEKFSKAFIIEGELLSGEESMHKIIVRLYEDNLENPVAVKELLIKIKK